MIGVRSDVVYVIPMVIMGEGRGGGGRERFQLLPICFSRWDGEGVVPLIVHLVLEVSL